jgi:hypothetical protein
MKGQFIFEFLVAGIVFFAIILYMINYLNVNVLDFKNRFYMDELESKALKVSEMLTGEKSNLSLVDRWPVFSESKIKDFNDYCKDNYDKLVRDLDLWERTVYGERPHKVKIKINTTSGSLLDCGPANLPDSASIAEAERFGVLNTAKELIILKVFVW